MRAELKRIDIENFKGCTQGCYDFGSRTKVSGANGEGKTTIADAFYWVLCDCDSNLKNNPAIFPSDGRECKPTVTLTFDIDGTEVTATKIQTRKVTVDKETGRRTESYSNNYEVNTVEYGLRDFQKKLTEYGFDFDKLLQLSHPNVFLSGMGDKKSREAMRNTLFEMSNAYTDLEVAKTIPEAKETAELLAKYSFAEIQSMQKNNQKKINDAYGKDGSKIDAEIAGIESSKVDYDVAELELQKKQLTEEMAQIRAAISTNGKAEIDKLQDEKMRLVFDANDCKRKEHEKNLSKRHDLTQKSVKADMQLEEAKKALTNLVNQIEEDKRVIESNNAEIEKMKPEYAEIKNSVFDEGKWIFNENEQICERCGQALPPSQIEERRKGFEERKANALKEFTESRNSKLANIKACGNALAIRSSELKKKIAESEVKRIESTALVEDLEKKSEAIKVELNNLPTEPDMSACTEYVNLRKRIAEIDNQVAELDKSDSESDQQYRDRLANVEAELHTVSDSLAIAGRNVTLDEKIEALRFKKLDLAQQKANCEKILFQLSLVEQRKNEMLQDSVNEHFKLVKWKLWGRQKNGEILTDVCTPMIDGKDFNYAVNTGLQIEAKLDIINGLQEYFNQHYPVFLDGAEALDSERQKNIDIDTQVVMLVVDDVPLTVNTEC